MAPGIMRNAFAALVCAGAAAVAAVSAAAPSPKSIQNDDQRPQNLLESARAALKNDEPAFAIQLAKRYLEENATDGAGHLVVGMALFEQNRPEEALRAFDQALSSPQGPSLGVAAFNRASALFTLERFEEAEEDYRRAARARPQLAPLAWANAAFSALEAEAPQRVRTALRELDALPLGAQIADIRVEIQRDLLALEQDLLMEQIERGLSDGTEAIRKGQSQKAIAQLTQTLELARTSQAEPADVADLEYALAYALYRDDQFAEAVELLSAADSTADPDRLYLLAMANYRNNNRRAAATLFDNILESEADDETKANAKRHRRALGFGPMASDPGLQARVALGLGYDTNVTQIGAVRSDVVNIEEQAPSGGIYLSAGADLSFAWHLTDKLFARVGYAFDQLAYINVSQDDFSAQSHALSTRAALKWGKLQVGGALALDAFLTGLRRYEPFLLNADGDMFLGLEEGLFTSTWLRGSLTSKHALDNAWEAFSGIRVLAELEQKFQGDRWRARATLSHRRENIGARAVDLGSLQLQETRRPVVGIYSAPFGYISNGLSLYAAARPVGAWRVSGLLALEDITYTDDSVLSAMTTIRLQEQQGEIARIRREDRRLTGRFEVGHPIGDWLFVTLRYETLLNRSNLNESNEDFGFDSKDFDKHTVSAEFEVLY